MTTIHDPRHHAFALNHGGGGIPALGFGTLVSDSSKTRHATVAAIEAGFRHLDCAERYRNEDGGRRSAQGPARRGAIRREDLFVTTKLWNNNHRPERVKPALQASLGRLGTGLGRPLSGAHPVRFQPGDDQDPRDPHGAIVYDDGVTLKETWAAMEGLVDEGLSRAIGLSDIDVEGTREIVDGARIKPAVVEVESHPYHPQWGLHGLCRTEGIVLLAFAPLGHAIGAATARRPADRVDRRRVGKTPAQVLLAWGIQRGSAVLTSSVDACPHRRERGHHRASRRRDPADQGAGDPAPVQLRRRRRRTGIPRSASGQLT